MRETVYSKAADKIRRHGWVKGILGDATVGFCVTGAVISVHEDMAHGILNLNRAGVWDQLYINLAALRQHLGRQVEPWNDAPERTVEDVFDLLQELHEKRLANAP